jgi:hypothetical protein
MAQEASAEDKASADVADLSMDGAENKTFAAMGVAKTISTVRGRPYTYIYMPTSHCGIDTVVLGWLRLYPLWILRLRSWLR